MVSGGPAQTHTSPITAAGFPPINTVGTPGPDTGPPTCGGGGVPGFNMGQTCILPTVAAGPGIAFSSLVYFYYSPGHFGHGFSVDFGLGAIELGAGFTFDQGVGSAETGIAGGLNGHGALAADRGIAVALQGYIAFGYSRDICFGSQFNILLRPNGHIFFCGNVHVLGAQVQGFHGTDEQRLFLGIESDDGAAVVVNGNFLGPVGVVELDGVPAAGGDGFDVVVCRHAAGVVHVEEAAGHKGPGGIALLEGDHDLVADFGDEPKAAVLFDDFAGAGAGRLYPHPVAGGILVLPEEAHLHTTQLVGVGIVGHRGRLGEGHRGLETFGQRQGFGGTGHAFKLVAVEAFLVYDVGDGQYPVAAQIGSAIFLEGLGQTGGDKLAHANGAGVACGFKYGTLRVHSAEMGTGSGHDVRLINHRSSGRELGGFLVEVRRTVLGHAHIAVHPVDALGGRIFLIVVGVGVVVVQLRIELLEFAADAQLLQFEIEGGSGGVFALGVAEDEFLSVVVEPLAAEGGHAGEELPGGFFVLGGVGQDAFEDGFAFQLNAKAGVFDFFAHEVADGVIDVGGHGGAAVEQQGGTAADDQGVALVTVFSADFDVGYEAGEFGEFAAFFVLHAYVEGLAKLFKYGFGGGAPETGFVGLVVDQHFEVMVAVHGLVQGEGFVVAGGTGDLDGDIHLVEHVGHSNNLG